MNAKFPQRPESHQLEEASRRYFERCLPRNWLSDRPGNDYGVDLRVDIFEGEAATGLELLVQLKASADSADGDSESVVLRVTTFNMLRNKLQVVMLVKYSEADGEAYWLLLKDAGQPSPGRDSFTVRIPKLNRLSRIDWDEIEAHVRSTSDEKLAAVRRRALNERRR